MCDGRPSDQHANQRHSLYHRVVRKRHDGRVSCASRVSQPGLLPDVFGKRVVLQKLGGLDRVVRQKSVHVGRTLQNDGRETVSFVEPRRQQQRRTDIYRAVQHQQNSALDAPPPQCDVLRGYQDRRHAGLHRGRPLCTGHAHRRDARRARVCAVSKLHQLCRLCCVSSRRCALSRSSCRSDKCRRPVCLHCDAAWRVVAALVRSCSATLKKIFQFIYKPYTAIQNMHVQRDVRVCFDFVDFLTYHMHDVGITEQDARDLSRTMRITDTRDLKHIHGIDYLEAREILTHAQMQKLLQLVHEVRADPAYADEYVRRAPRPLCTRRRFVFGPGKVESRCDLFTSCKTVVQATRRLL